MTNQNPPYDNPAAQPNPTLAPNNYAHPPKKGVPTWVKILVPLVLVGGLLIVALFALILFFAFRGSSNPIDKAESTTELIQSMRTYTGFECSDPKSASVTIRSEGKVFAKLPAVKCQKEAFIVDFTTISEEKAKYAKGAAAIIIAQNFGEGDINDHTLTGKKYMVILDPSISLKDMKDIIGGGYTTVDLSKNEVNTVEKH